MGDVEKKKQKTVVMAALMENHLDHLPHRKDKASHHWTRYPDELLAELHTGSKVLPPVNTMMGLEGTGLGSSAVLD